MVASEVVGTSQGFQIARAMSWSTSILAIVVGVLGVMNTMMMTVFERTQEICVLLAIGWKRSRIVRMVLWESALLGFLGGLCGVAIGVVGVKLLTTLPSIRGMLEPLHPQGSPGRGIRGGLIVQWRSCRRIRRHHRVRCSRA